MSTGIDFGEVMVKIRARAKCSEDEAWSGLAQAFLYLDRSYSLNEQYSYLIDVGTSFVKREIQRYYSPVGIYCADGTEVLENVKGADDCWRHLDWFDEGPVREYARLVGEGFVKSFTFDSVRNFLRKNHKEISDYENCRKIYNRVRECTERLYFVDPFLSGSR